MQDRLEWAHFTAPDAEGGSTELTAGIRWVRLPVPGPLQHINVWLLPADDGCWLVDCGLDTRAVSQAWERVTERPLPGGRLLGILVTHHHPDHYGCAARLAASHGVTVRSSEATEAAVARGLAPADEALRERVRGWAERCGVVLDDELWQFMAGGGYARLVGGLAPAGPPLMHGETLALRDRWQVSLHDGHAPGHACLYAKGPGILVSGDQVLPAISPNVSLFPSTEAEDPLGAYLASLERLRGLPDEVLVLPSHGRPFRGLAARIDGLVAEHHGRLAQVARLLSAPRSLAEIVAALFGHRRLDPLNRVLAIGETLAHLRHLEVGGRVARKGAGPTLRWLA